eukprot:CAMPEP_0174714854 /NCGR_PEP_ID=MMETSP1094-20130205/19566_1 /TAXON_ID=156173 /ORGANISM="Chrysochromulina brevifilum, Strain UTEX LB 985" /LENGTH=73 /DNA_ID=CAMNT_0015914305 /DNA_START=67 /DNA_END=285 /DNA_ORIENTATION=+
MPPGPASARAQRVRAPASVRHKLRSTCLTMGRAHVPDKACLSTAHTALRSARNSSRASRRSLFALPDRGRRQE